MGIMVTGAMVTRDGALAPPAWAGRPFKRRI
jgi:hypothetical protein